MGMSACLINTMTSLGQDSTFTTRPVIPVIIASQSSNFESQHTVSCIYKSKLTQHSVWKLMVTGVQPPAGLQIFFLRSFLPSLLICICG